MKYWKLETSHIDNPKIWDLLDTHGLAGYGFYLWLINYLHKQENSGYQIELDDRWIRKTARELYLTDKHTVIRYLDTFSELKLINPQLYHEQIISSDGITSRADSYMKEKQKNALRQARHREKRKASQGSNALRNAKSNDVTPPDAYRSSTSVPDLQTQISEADSNPDAEPVTEKEKEPYLTPSSLNKARKSEQIQGKTSFQKTQGGSKTDEQAGISESMPKSGEFSRIDISVNSQDVESEAQGSKKKRVAVPRRRLENFLEIFNEHKPRDFSAAKKLTDKRARMLGKFVREHGEDAESILIKALTYAQTDPHWQGKNLTFENYFTNDKPYQHYEKSLVAIERKPLAAQGSISSYFGWCND